MIKAYPKIKEHCFSKGYEFQVVDMRWGVRNQAADDHMTTELCIHELRECQKISKGPNFIVSIAIVLLTKNNYSGSLVNYEEIKIHCERNPPREPN